MLIVAGPRRQVTVRIDDLLEAFEMMTDGYRSFLNVDTGKMVTVSREVLKVAEAGAGDEDCTDPEWDLAVQMIASWDRWARLPTQFDIHEWQIMEDFARSLRQPPAGEELLDALHGRGAFRSFKTSIRRLRIEEAWFALREAALREIARDWCTAQGFAWK